MTIQSSAAIAEDLNTSSRSLDTPDFLKRLAEDLMIKSGSDLPLSCFVEQIRLQLAGGRLLEELQGPPTTGANNNHEADYQSSNCFKAWAMPD